MRAEPESVEQLFVNLLFNAAQAIPEGNARPKLKSASACACSPATAAAVEIADTGVGIPIEIHERIFQPFFTTRPVGKGTGLGLSICRAIVTALGGRLVPSDAPRGTTFRVVHMPTAEGARMTHRRPRMAAPGQGRAIYWGDSFVSSSLLSRDGPWLP